MQYVGWGMPLEWLYHLILKSEACETLWESLLQHPGDVVVELFYFNQSELSFLVLGVWSHKKDSSYIN